MQVGLLRRIDKYILGVLIYILLPLVYLFRPSSIIKRPKKILVIRIWALGSTLLTFPIIERLKEFYGKGVKYDILASSRNIGIFKNQSQGSEYINLFSVKGLWTLIKRFKYYDIVVDCEEYFKISSVISIWVGKITVGYNNIPSRGIAYSYGIHYNEKKHNIVNSMNLLNPLAIPFVEPIMIPMKYSDNDSKLINSFLEHNVISYPAICIHAGGAETSPDRFWDPNNRILLINKLVSSYPSVTILLTGGNFEKQVNSYIVDNVGIGSSIINLSGKFSLSQLAFLFKKIDIMISNDTGPMHLAAAMGVKTIGLFGPNSPEAFGPRPLTSNKGLYKGDGILYIRPHLGQFLKDTQKTVDRITPDDVLVAINQRLKP